MIRLYSRRPSRADPEVSSFATVLKKPFTLLSSLVAFLLSTVVSASVCFGLKNPLKFLFPTLLSSISEMITFNFIFYNGLIWQAQVSFREIITSKKSHIMAGYTVILILRSIVHLNNSTHLHFWPCSVLQSMKYIIYIYIIDFPNQLLSQIHTTLLHFCIIEEWAGQTFHLKYLNYW